ncbi:molybdate ABC transporter substrate-binding protein [Bacillus sp. V3B]|uniref:molybdate ABC transporter substrate-binding protein n=1 Tax=Bacillus sp. V3B TaxID=2804915 RepID=UPI0021092758|nr:molybdate ABC transporter substrate-binding protein [Bacillus sp. V3B]MCQ6276486.1 molybdate ABC transporter substrate-binding protein [Bacillus sp. V3B]
MKREIILIVCLCFLIFLLSACNIEKDMKTSENENLTITVAAASSLQLAFTEVAQNFETLTNSKVQLTFGSSGRLAQQIENGAPYDVFASANVDFVEKLKESGKTIPETQTLYAKGRIGLTTLKNNPIEINDLNDLLLPAVKKIAIANPDHAPYGLAAKQALESAGLWEQIEDKIVPGKSISDTLTLVTTGNAEVGLVSHSLVDDQLNFTLLDEDLHNPLNQAITVIKDTSQVQLAEQFIGYVTGSEGRKVLDKYGFDLPEVQE